MTDAKAQICKELLHIAAQVQSLATGKWTNNRTAVNEIDRHIEALEEIRERLKAPPPLPSK
jgi:hypothetical protein